VEPPTIRGWAEASLCALAVAGKSNARLASEPSSTSRGRLPMRALKRLGLKKE
jgi:hypothetical protein